MLFWKRGLHDLSVSHCTCEPPKVSESELSVVPSLILRAVRYLLRSQGISHHLGLTISPERTFLELTRTQMIRSWKLKSLLARLAHTYNISMRVLSELSCLNLMVIGDKNRVETNATRSFDGYYN